MFKKKRQNKRDLEQAEQENQAEAKTNFKEAIEKEYDGFAGAPTTGSPDHGLSIYIKLHQVVEHLAVLRNEIKQLRQDVNSAEPETPNAPQENKEIY